MKHLIQTLPLCVLALLFSGRITQGEIADAVYRDQLEVAGLAVNWHTALTYSYNNGTKTSYVIEANPPFVSIDNWNTFLGNTGGTFQKQACPANLSLGMRQLTLQYASAQVGTPYWDYYSAVAFGYFIGNPLGAYEDPTWITPSWGFRCDGLVEWVYEQIGYNPCVDAQLYNNYGFVLVDFYACGPYLQSTKIPTAIQTYPTGVAMTYPTSTDYQNPTTTSSSNITLGGTASDAQSGLSYNQPYDYWVSTWSGSSWSSWSRIGSGGASLSYAVTPGVNYSFYVTAYDNDGNWLNSSVYYLYANPSSSAPTVQTGQATGVTSSTATLNATVTSTGGSSIIDARFEYTSSSFPGTAIYSVPLSGNTFSYNLTGLQPNTFYTYHAYAKNSAGLWNTVVNNITFTTASTTQQPSITNPTQGSTLTSSSVTFQWSSGTSVTEYYLSVGNSLGANDIYGQYVGLNLSTTVNGLPTDGRTLYVRLYWQISGLWYTTDYTYTAYTVTVTPTRIISLGGNLAFGSVSVGSSPQSTLTIYNNGNSTMTVNSISYPSGFSGNWSGTISAGGSHAVTVTFSPTSGTSYGGTVTVNSDATSGTSTLNASGTGVSTITVSLQTSGSGGGYFTVDGTDYGSQTFNWIPGTCHTIQANASPEGSSHLRNLWTGWSDGGDVSHMVCPTTDTNYTANFKLQCWFGVGAGTGGTVTVSPVSDWYDYGQSVTITAFPDSGYSFAGWTSSEPQISGTYSGMDNPATVTVNTWFSETANFGISVTVKTSPPGLVFMVDGQNYSSAQTFGWTLDSPHFLNVTSPQTNAAGIKYVWTGWDDGLDMFQGFNYLGDITSYTASFKMWNQLTGQMLDANTIRLSYVGDPDANYALERTLNLFPANWMPLVTNLTGEDGLLIFTNTVNSSTNYFWRVRSVP